MNAGKLSDAINEKLIMQAVRRAQQAGMVAPKPIVEPAQAAKKVAVITNAVLDRIVDHAPELAF